MKYKVGDEVLVKCKINYVDNDASLPYEVSRAGCIPRFSKPLYILARDDDIETMSAEEAWEIAKKLFADYSNSELDEIFGKGWSFPKLMELTPQQAKAKIEAWEAEKEVKAGDEVEFDDTANDLHRSMYVTSKYNNTDYCGICRNGDTYCVHKSELKKTGRHIDITGLLNQIGGDE